MQTTLRKFSAVWPLVIFPLLPALAHSQTAFQAWIQTYHGPGDGDDEPYATAVDGNNSVIVTGQAFISGSSYAYVTIKYSSHGVPLWTNRYTGPGNGWDCATAVAVDGSNNVIVTGQSAGIGSSSDYTTIEYSSDGIPLWTNRYNGPGNSSDGAKAVAVDADNNVIVTGYSYSSGTNSAYATIKYSSVGVPLWTNRWSGSAGSLDSPTALSLDSSNNVIVTGASYESGGSSDYATVKYSNAGTPLWTNRYNGPGNGSDEAYAVAVDGGNNVIVTGETISTESSADYTTIKYSSAGVPLWTNRYSGPVYGGDFAVAVVVDTNNSVIVTGQSLGSSSGEDYVTIKYSGAGVPLWTNRFTGPGNDYESYDHPYALAVDGRDNVIVTGFSSSNEGHLDCVTIKYSSAGEPLWTNRNTLPDNGPETSAMAVDRNANVVVTGSWLGTAGIWNIVTIKYICGPLPVLTGLQLTNGTFQLRVDDVLQPGTLVIEASTNLADWSRVFTNTTPTNVLFYTDPDAGNLPTRFYRAAQSL